MQSAIAATPTAAWKGYLLGGIMWFCIPFTLSTSLGLATVALDLPVSVDEANMGLVPVAAASVRSHLALSDVLQRIDVPTCLLTPCPPRLHWP